MGNAWHVLWLLASVGAGVGLLFAALCVLLALATSRLGHADDPEGPHRPLWR